MMRTRCNAAAVALAAMALCCTLLADDTALRVLGGAVAPMDQHPAISMDRCIVNADVYADESRVRCEFVFTNHGPAQTVTMGFPAQGAFGDSGRPGYSPRLADLRTWVDGAEVATSLRPGVQTDREQPAESWYVKRVPFAAAQARVIRVEYTQPNGEDSMGGRWFPYAVSTGASWRGPIGELQVTVTWREDWAWDPKTYSFQAWLFRYSDDGRRASWLGTQVEPERDISLYFWPGWQVYLRDNAWLVRPYADGFDMSLWHLADLLQAEKRWDAQTRTAELLLADGTSVRVTEGRWNANVIPEPGGPAAIVTLPRSAYMDHGRLWMAADGVLSELGYGVIPRERTRRIDLTPPG